MAPRGSYEVEKYEAYQRARVINVVVLASVIVLYVVGLLSESERFRFIAFLIGVIGGTLVVVRIGERLWALPSWLRVRARLREVALPHFTAGNFGAARTELETLLRTAAGRQFIFVRILLLTSLANACASMGDTETANLIATNILESKALFAPKLRRRRVAFSGYVCGVAVTLVLAGNVAAAKRLLSQLTSAEREAHANIILVSSLVSFCAGDADAVAQVERASGLLDSLPYGGVFRAMLLQILAKHAAHIHDHDRASKYAALLESAPAATREAAARALANT